MRGSLPVVIVVVISAFAGLVASHLPQPGNAPAAPTVKAAARAEAAAPSPRPAPQAAAAPASADQSHPTALPAPQRQAAAQSAPAAAPASAASQMAAHSATGGDPVSGGQSFRKCQACHSLEPGKNILGPSLAGIIGKKAGSQPGFNYSAAMKSANITWDAATLDAYITDPQKVVPGNRMPFPGLKTANERTDIIAYIAAAPAAGIVAQGARTAPRRGLISSAQAAPSVATYIADAKYTLKTGIAEGRMVYIGVGGGIEGKVNPTLTAAEGQAVQITLINGEGAEHDIVFPGQDTKSPRVVGKGASTTIAFRTPKAGDFIYFCGVPGHQQAGMQGQFVVTALAPAQTLVEADISRDPADLPPPLLKRTPQLVRVDLETTEVEGRLAEATTFGYWTFGGKVPGPFLRVRVGDTVEVHLKNAANSGVTHSVDFHAATGPGGGAASLQVDPGDEKSMTFKALVPGLFVYHCATPMVAHHVANGMYGMILVEPEQGLPPVDHEFYVMQGEIYTDAPFGQQGSTEFSVEKLLAERPEYFVFNGSVGALTKFHPLKAKVGDTVRIYFGVGGPNYTSSFHVIGEIFDRVYNDGDVISRPAQGVQTITVPSGGAAITEFKLQVPGNYTLVDHALARLERGLAGLLMVDGPPNPAIYNGQVMPGMGH